LIRTCKIALHAEHIKVDAAGGFCAYEKAHRKLLTNTFATKLPRLPIEVVSHFVSFAFHTGYY